MKMSLRLITVFMISLFAIGASATTHTVNQVGLTFDPQGIVINVGDTVQWNWTAGFHTVTNGINPSDPSLGTLFDATLSSGSPMFSYTFTSAGNYPYICRPHFGLDMWGDVHVEDIIDNDTPTWGAVKTLYR